MKRSWVNGVPVPPNIRQGRHWADWFVDLRETWQLGDRQAEGSLEQMFLHLTGGERPRVDRLEPRLEAAP